MYADEFRAYCLRLPEVTEGLPFGPEVIVFKVCGKMFALSGIDELPLSVNLKCDPPTAELLREKYPAITPGFHMNKKHWNSVLLDGSIPQQLVFQLIDHSYLSVVKKLPLKDRKPLLAVLESRERSFEFHPEITI